MKGKHIKSKRKLFPKIYKQIGIVALIAFAIYILIKTVQTQKMKKMEGFKEGRRNIQRRDSSTTEENDSTTVKNTTKKEEKGSKLQKSTTTNDDSNDTQSPDTSKKSDSTSGNTFIINAS